MLGNGSSGLRFRGTHHHHKPTLPTTNNPTSWRFLRFPVRCSLDLTTHYSVLGLTPFASKSDVKQAYKRLALKYHPDVHKGEDVPGKDKAFKEIKSAYECLMQNFEEREHEELQRVKDCDEYDEWEERMGYGGTPVVYNPFFLSVFSHHYE